MVQERDDVPVAVDDQSTGLPGLRSWPAVYWFVGGTFMLWLMLLTALTWWYS